MNRNYTWIFVIQEEELKDERFLRTDQNIILYRKLNINI